MKQNGTDTLTLKVLEKGNLPTSGKPFCVALLGSAYAEQVLALHENVIASLPPDEKSFILPKDTDYFRRHMDQPGNAVIGILDEEGNLLAKSVIHQTEDASILQAVTVHPGCKGNGLMQAMVRHWLTHAAAHGQTAAMAEMENRNTGSLIAFMKAGLIVGATGLDRSNPEQRNSIGGLRIKYAVFRSLSPVFNQAAENDQIVSWDMADAAGQKMLLNDGFCGTGIDARKGVMTFEQTPKPTFLNRIYV